METEETAERTSPELSLVFPNAQGHPVVFPIPEGTVTVGRADDNDVLLEHPSVEPHQVVIVREGPTLELRDLFAGETRVNEEVRRSGPLSAGDVLRLGEVKLRIMKVAPGRMTRALPARERANTRRLSGRPTAAPTARPPRRPDESSRPTVAMPQPQHQDEDARRARESDARRARALARARKLSDEIMPLDDFEEILDRVASGFVEVFSAERAVTVLFEEDGRNPLLTVERRRDGTDEGAGVAEEIIDRLLQVRSVIKVAGGQPGLGGLATPLLTQGRALGLLYFERIDPQNPLGADDVHLMALLGNQISLLIAPLVG